MNQQYDAIVIGAGHNGLVTAGYLARAGKKVLVLERRPIVGGAAVTEELYPGFKFSVCADGAGRLLPEVVRDLGLEKQGLEVLDVDPVIFAPQPDGTNLTLWRDPVLSAREIHRLSRLDADRYPAFIALISRLAGLVSDLMRITPPGLPEPDRGDLFAMMQFGLRARRLGKKDLSDALRILPMPVTDLLDEWFEGEPLRAVIATAGITGITLGPKDAGTAYYLLAGAVGAGNGAFRSAGSVRGGMGALSKALARAAERYGVEIKTSAEVVQITNRDGMATGVSLASGQQFTARRVISNADPRTTYLDLLDPQFLDPYFLWQLRNIKYRGSGARVHLALSGLPRFVASNGEGEDGHLKGYIAIAPSIDYLEYAYDDAKYGDISRQPYLLALIPSLSDPSLAPEGQHVLSVYMQYAPYQLKEGDWDKRREELGDVVVDTLEHYAPGIKDLILYRQVLTPLDLERIYNLPEGNPHHGEMTLDQFLFMRPLPGWAQYRTPVSGLYLCGAGTHPGGGVTGAPGYNASREVLKDWGK